MVRSEPPHSLILTSSVSGGQTICPGFGLASVTTIPNLTTRIHVSRLENSHRLLLESDSLPRSVSRGSRIEHGQSGDQVGFVVEPRRPHIDIRVHSLL